jgi:hypothetical protein
MGAARVQQFTTDQLPYYTKYYAAHRERIKTLRKQSYGKRKKEINELRRKKYSKEDKEKRNRWHREYYKKLKESNPLAYQKHKENAHKYYLKNKEQRIAHSQVWKKSNPRRVKGYRIAKYGITLEQYEAQLKEQNHCCAICRNPLDLGKHTHQDHCHITNKTRGILCTNCNKGIGCFRDSIASLENAIEYLKGHA